MVKTSHARHRHNLNVQIVHADSHVESPCAPTRYHFAMRAWQGAKPVLFAGRMRMQQACLGFAVEIIWVLSIKLTNLPIRATAIFLQLSMSNIPAQQSSVRVALAQQVNHKPCLEEIATTPVPPPRTVGCGLKIKG